MLAFFILSPDSHFGRFQWIQLSSVERCRRTHRVPSKCSCLLPTECVTQAESGFISLASHVFPDFDSDSRLSFLFAVFSSGSLLARHDKKLQFEIFYNLITFAINYFSPSLTRQTKVENFQMFHFTCHRNACEDVAFFHPSHSCRLNRKWRHTEWCNFPANNGLEMLCVVTAMQNMQFKMWTTKRGKLHTNKMLASVISQILIQS